MGGREIGGRWERGWVRERNSDRKGGIQKREREREKERSCEGQREREIERQRSKRERQMMREKNMRENLPNAENLRFNVSVSSTCPCRMRTNRRTKKSKYKYSKELTSTGLDKDSPKIYLVQNTNLTTATLCTMLLLLCSLTQNNNTKKPTRIDESAD